MFKRLEKERAAMLVRNWEEFFQSFNLYHLESDYAEKCRDFDLMKKFFKQFKQALNASPSDILTNIQKAER